MTDHLSFHITDSALSEAEKLQHRQQLLAQVNNQASSELFATPFDVEQVGRKNCENLIGSVSVPVGMVGPVRVAGSVLNEEVLIPVATSEGALVASMARGAKAINQSQAGGAKIMVKKVGMTRAPVFRCGDGEQALWLASWFSEHQTELARHCEATSSHLKFLNLTSWVRGRLVFVRMAFDTDQAMGMNMVTIAIQQAWQQLRQDFSELEEVELLSLSSNACTDKKDSVVNRILGRGYWVQAEVELSGDVLSQVLKVSAAELIDTHVVKNLIGSNIGGSFSQNMQIGNVIAALYLVTGQDLAHITEGSQAATTVEATERGLYVSVTLPNINVGVVGGGTWLPAQTQARQAIRFGQNLNAEQLAGVIGVAALAAEVSGLAALSTHTLAQAHQKFSRVTNLK